MIGAFAWVAGLSSLAVAWGGPGPVLAQGQMPHDRSDGVIYNRRSFDVWFVRTAPDTFCWKQDW